MGQRTYVPRKITRYGGHVSSAFVHLFGKITFLIEIQKNIIRLSDRFGNRELVILVINQLLSVGSLIRIKNIKKNE